MALQPALASNAQPALRAANHQPAMLVGKRQSALVSLSQPALQGYAFDSLVLDPLTLSPAAWYKPETLSALADGAAVASWTDSSGNARHATPSGFAAPVYKTAIQNGRPVVRFDGTTTALVSAFALAQPASVFIVARYRSARVTNDTLFDGATNNKMRVWRAASDTLLAYAGGGFDTQAVTTPESWHAIEVVFSGAASQINVDGVAGTLGTTGTQAPGGITLGMDSTTSAGQGGPVDVGEVLVFGSVLSAGNRAALNEYLSGRWATP